MVVFVARRKNSLRDESVVCGRTESIFRTFFKSSKTMYLSAVSREGKNASDLIDAYSN